MKVNITLKSNGNKNLNDTIYDIIDNSVDGGIQKFGAKAAYWTFGIFGDNGSNTLFALVHSLLENLIKDFFSDNNIYATPQNLVLTKKGEELQGSIDVDDIDYIKSLTINQQRIIDGLKTLAPNNIAWEIIGMLDEDTTPIVTSVLQIVNDEKKETIIKLLIKEFHSNICKAFTGFFADNKIDLAVESISLA